LSEYAHAFDPSAEVCNLCGRSALELANEKKPKPCDRAVEIALLDRLRTHQFATVDDLFDGIPSDEIRLMIAGLGRKAIRIERVLSERKAAKHKAVENKAA
jgi:hypothetical protein